MTWNTAELVQRVRALDPAERVIAAVHLLDVLEEIDGVWSDTADPGDPPSAAARSVTYAARTALLVCEHDPPYR